MLNSSKTSEETSAPEDNSATVLPMSVDEETVKAITSALSGPPDFFNPSDFLTSPVSPWDELLTTPALDGDAGMTPDIYNTSPALMGLGDDFDNMPSLFDTTPYDAYDTKAIVGSSLSPSDLPLPAMDGLYEISPGTPAIDAMSLQSSPLHADGTAVLSTRRKSAPTGTRKNISPESLVPYDAPIQTRQYRTPSSTSRKTLPATFARKRARTQGPEEEETGTGPTVSEEDAIRCKRLQNTLAARRSRKRKLEYQRELEDAIEAERKEKEMWRARAFVLEALLRDKGHEVPRMSDA